MIKMMESEHRMVKTMVCVVQGLKKRRRMYIFQPTN